MELGTEKEKIWIWSVDPINWDTVRTDKVWGVDVIKKSEKVKKGDIIIFYVTGSNYFQGIYKTVSDWHGSSRAWPDGRRIELEIDLEEIETGYASTKKLAEALEFVTNPSRIGTVLMGVSYGPANFGRSISSEDYQLILDELGKNKAPLPIGKQVKVDAPEEYKAVLTHSPLRLHLIKNLFENLMGPRKGPGEEVENVSNAYVVGILRTKFEKPDLNTGSDPSDTSMPENIKTDANELQEEDEDKVSPDYDLNPILGARSIGLSFAVSGKESKIKACFTWGRYEKIQASKKSFRRQMNFFVEDFEISNKEIKIKLEQSPTSNKRITKEGVEIEIISTRISKTDDKYHVSIFLVNKTPYKGERQSIQDWVFQPQIRVNCNNGTTLQDLGYLDPETPKERIENSLYAKRRSFGRGHFCGAIWNEVDPEDFESEGFSTFNWADSKSKHFPKEFAKEFTRPHIRTEYFPTYSILQPDIAEKSKLTFNAEKFSEVWQPEVLDDELGKIVVNYKKWIETEFKDLDKIPKGSSEYESVKSNSDNCNLSATRINDGIKFLKSNEIARLAFCFMNKVIALKSEWEGRDDFAWWEFQMAFILQCLRGVAQDDQEQRDLCDILWFPTGGGKTEAYLGLTIFAIIYRRLQSYDGFSTDGGVSVISRYTLRLLTIQQFQRAVGAMVAADFLRVEKWFPKNATISSEDINQKVANGTIWGERRISIGLFVGRTATPNHFHDKKYELHAEGILSDRKSGEPTGEPSQVLNCPCCGTVLAVPSSQKMGLDENINTIHWIFSSVLDLKTLQNISSQKFSGNEFQVEENGTVITPVGNSTGPRNSKYFEIKISFKRRSKAIINAERISAWWNIHVAKALGASSGAEAKVASTSPSRPGYFFVKHDGRRQDFSIHCPNSGCKLNQNQLWFENFSSGPRPLIPEPFKMSNDPARSLFMPISAYTVDEQIYRKCPSMIISTVDKFAMLPFFYDFASIFGNVDEYHEIKGYGRANVTEYDENGENSNLVHNVKPFLPPSLIIQDELHLIEGPLGSMVGAYELAVDILSTVKGFKPKYVASSATVKEAKSQVGTIFRKNGFVFPPQGSTVVDNYFSENKEDRESNSEKPGRLYMGICAPQKILVLPVRIWASLLSEVYRMRKNPSLYGLDSKYQNDPSLKSKMTFEEFVDEETDWYWTLIGYFNAKKELQIARSLYDDDIKRDVRNMSAQSASSIEYQLQPLKLQPGLRFYPIFFDKNIEITNIILYCSNSKGSVTLRVYDNNINNEPKSLVRETIFDHRNQQCSKGQNIFRLENPYLVNMGEIIWIAVANNDRGTKFETGFSPLKPIFSNITDNQLNEIFDKNVFPVNPNFNPESTTVRISAASSPRELGPEPIELTGNTESQDLPNVLKMLDKKPGNEVDCVFTTAVFGTGIDIQRLGLMIVMGQPKTTSTYIQSTGRVGRTNPGLVITWHKATNVRDLNHYENFVGYHRMLQRYVEPISASPYAEESLRLCLGPVLVAILRNARNIEDIPIPKDWIDNEHAPLRMSTHNEDPEVTKICTEIGKMLLDSNIPQTRKPTADQAEIKTKNVVKGWHKDARLLKEKNEGNKKLFYNEWTINKVPENNVVLGSPQHAIAKKISVYQNVRTSMREVESTANFGED